MRKRLNPSQSPRLWRWALALVAGGLVALGYGAPWFWLGPLWALSLEGVDALAQRKRGPAWGPHR